jgi:TRAP-type C4-dicarboxylate transport system permease small subunit
MNDMGKFERLVEKGHKATGIISGAGMVLAGLGVVSQVVIITAYVIARDFFNQTWMLTTEWAGYFLVLIAYLGGAYALRAGGHVRVSLVVRLLRPQVRASLDALTTLPALGAVCVMIWLSTNRLIQAWHDHWNSVLGTPMWIPLLFIPVGLALLVPELVMHFIRAIMNVKRGVTGEAVEELKEILEESKRSI